MFLQSRFVPCVTHWHLIFHAPDYLSQRFGPDLAKVASRYLFHFLCRNYNVVAFSSAWGRGGGRGVRHGTWLWRMSVRYE